MQGSSTSKEKLKGKKEVNGSREQVEEENNGEGTL